LKGGAGGSGRQVNPRPRWPGRGRANHRRRWRGAAVVAGAAAGGAPGAVIAAVLVCARTPIAVGPGGTLPVARIVGAGAGWRTRRALGSAFRRCGECRRLVAPALAVAAAAVRVVGGAGARRDHPRALVLLAVHLGTTEASVAAIQRRGINVGITCVISDPAGPVAVPLALQAF